MKSIYESMEQSFVLAYKALQKGFEVKLLMRHSLRESGPGIMPKFEDGLTREGKILAKHCGRSLEGISLGRIVTSASHRCMQTGEYIAQGYGRDIIIQQNDILSYLWICDREKWRTTFESYNQNIRTILETLLDRQSYNKEILGGVYPLQTTLELLLKTMWHNPKDTIFTQLPCIDLWIAQPLPHHTSYDIESCFSNYSHTREGQDIQGVLDIFVTHDSFIMLFLCALLDKKLADMEWIYMLEGAFVWFDTKDKTLHCAWRGIEYSVGLEYKYENSIL